MPKTLKQEIWWLAITLSGASQGGGIGACAAALIGAALLKEMASALWLSLPSLGRDRPTMTSLRTTRVAARLSNRREHRHAYF